MPPGEQCGRNTPPHPDVERGGVALAQLVRLGEREEADLVHGLWRKRGKKGRAAKGVFSEDVGV